MKYFGPKLCHICYAGHFSVKKMVHRINQYFYWSGMRGDVHLYKKCAACVTSQWAGCAWQASFSKHSSRGSIWLYWNGFCRDGQKPKGKSVCPCLTKWLEVYALQDRLETWSALQNHPWPSCRVFGGSALRDCCLAGNYTITNFRGSPPNWRLSRVLQPHLQQMLKKLVTKKGHNWGSLLGPLLFAYQTTSHCSTGSSPLYLFYGRSPQLPTSIDFNLPIVRYPVGENDYTKKLVREMKRARTVAQKNIQAKQAQQKKHYKIKELRIGDLVMLKTAPNFCLDWSFKGPFVVQSVTLTNAVIKAKDIEDTEAINLSRQRLSLCSKEMKGSTPWIGHGKKLRKRRLIRKRGTSDKQTAIVDSDKDQEESPQQTVVTRSRQGFHLVSCCNCPMVSQQKRGEVVRTSYRGITQSRDTREQPQWGTMTDILICIIVVVLVQWFGFMVKIPNNQSNCDLLNSMAAESQHDLTMRSHTSVQGV